MTENLWSAARDVSINHDNIGAKFYSSIQALAGAIELHSKYSTEGVDLHFINNTRSGLDLKVSAYLEATAW